MASASSTTFTDAPIKVVSPLVTYTEDAIEAKYSYETTSVSMEGGTLVATPVKTGFTFRTQSKVPKIGVMVAGLGGNNGSTLTASILANKMGIKWMTKEGERSPNYYGSVTQASTVRLGADASGKDVYVPMSRVLPMAHPNDWEVTGWDISGANLADAMSRAGVLPYDLQRQLATTMKGIVPLPGIYDPDFIAANQEDRADNVLPGTKAEQLAAVRQQIADFKAASGVDKVIVVWSANTERFSDVAPGLNTTSAELLASIASGASEVSPSTIMAVAAIQEGCTYINGSPQNTFVPGVIQLAAEAGVYIGGDDFKSGQTKMKSVLVDFLVGAGIKPASIVSYNHLGNNDGKNLSAPKQFRSKEISKSNVVDDMVASNGILYAPGETPDHCVVIKYVPYVGDSKRAMDEYTSEIFMGGTNTIVMHNTCEDSLLAVPLIIDLVALAELSERMTLKADGEEDFHGFHSVLSLLSYLLKAPLVPTGAPVINALFKQREAISNVLRAAVGLGPENHMLLEHRMPTTTGWSAAVTPPAGAAAEVEAKE